MPAQNKEKSTFKERESLVEENVRHEPEKEIFSWTAPARPFKRRDREFYVTIIAIAAIVGLILFLVEGVMPVILIVSLVFLFYVLSTVEPDEIKYEITNKGIKIADRRTDWEQIFRFWFSRRFNNDLLIVEIANLPGRLELVINTETKKELKEKLLDYIPEEETPPSALDKAANWFAKKLPN